MPLRRAFLQSSADNAVFGACLRHPVNAVPRFRYSKPRYKGERVIPVKLQILREAFQQD
jgi:hypothetical protein